MLLSLQEGIWRTAATLTLTYFVGWGLKVADAAFEFNSASIVLRPENR